MKTKLQAKLKEIARNKRKDYEDFLKIWCGCSEFDENGDLHCGKWSKLDSLDLPFSKNRTAYLLGSEWYDFQKLFNEYEIFDNKYSDDNLCRWRPFGYQE